MPRRSFKIRDRDITIVSNPSVRHNDLKILVPDYSITSLTLCSSLFCYVLLPLGLQDSETQIYIL